MSKSYCSLGLMSGTSADGVDASIIQSDGDNEFKVILDKYFVYNQEIYKTIHELKEEVSELKDLQNFAEKVNLLEKKITLFHVDVVHQIMRECKLEVDLIGFHGQTIFHNSAEKISKQLGDGKLLSKNTKKTVIYNFRQNDLRNGGSGAPLTPIFHKLLKIKFKIKDATFVNIGGITNITSISNTNDMLGADVGPGMCLIDRWLREKINKNFDKDGIIAESGNVNEKILGQLLKNFYEKEKKLASDKIQSLDTKHFDLSLVKKLSLEDGAATLTEFTAQIIISALNLNKFNNAEIILCGGGRNNKFLFKKIKKKNSKIKLIDEYGINGDFVESQAFAYLAIRSFLNLPISFPKTTGVDKPCVGGTIIKN